MDSPVSIKAVERATYSHQAHNPTISAKNRRPSIPSGCLLPSHFDLQLVLISLRSSPPSDSSETSRESLFHCKRTSLHPSLGGGTPHLPSCFNGTLGSSLRASPSGSLEQTLLQKHSAPWSPPFPTLWETLPFWSPAIRLIFPLRPWHCHPPPSGSPASHVASPHTPSPDLILGVPSTSDFQVFPSLF